MKTKLFLFFVTLMVSFASCEPIGVTPINNYKEAWDVMQMYLSKNYTDGDTIIFTTESQMTDTFIISYSDGTCMTQSTDTSNTDNEELGYIIRDTIAISCGVHFSNDSYSIEVVFSQSEITGELASGAFFEIYQDKRHEERLWADLDLTQLKNKNDYTITNSIGQSCYLRKNEGIISFSDEKGNTWTKK
jgi:hypothetical protein